MKHPFEYSPRTRVGSNLEPLVHKSKVLTTGPCRQPPVCLGSQDLLIVKKQIELLCFMLDGSTKGLMAGQYMLLKSLIPVERAGVPDQV